MCLQLIALHTTWKQFCVLWKSKLLVFLQLKNTIFSNRDYPCQVVSRQTNPTTRVLFETSPPRPPPQCQCRLHGEPGLPPCQWAEIPVIPARWCQKRSSGESGLSPPSSQCCRGRHGESSNEVLLSLPAWVLVSVEAWWGTWTPTSEQQ